MEASTQGRSAVTELSHPKLGGLLLVPHARITTIMFAPGGLEQVWDLVPSFVRTLHDQPGFVSYQFFQTGPDSAVTIALYASQGQSDAAAAAAAGWIENHAAHLIVRRDVRPGEELLYETAAVPANNG